MKFNKSVIILRSVHAAFAIYFIICVFCIFYSAITLQINFLLKLALISLFVEGLLVFILNKGHYPLAPLQRKLNDPIPFFNLFLPDYLAKKAIPFFTGLTFLGLIILAVRLFL